MIYMSVIICPNCEINRFVVGLWGGCWCAPFPCHGDVLKEMVENNG